MKSPDQLPVVRVDVKLTTVFIGTDVELALNDRVGSTRGVRHVE